MIRPGIRQARGTLCLLLLFCASLLAGCWDRKAVEDVGFVTVLGIDQGIGNTLRITVQISNPRVISAGRTGGGGGGDKQQPVIVQRIDQPTISQALRDLETFTNRRISFVQTRVIIFGRALVEAGLESHIGALTRFREFRRSTQVMVADGTAEEVLTTRPALERDPAVFLEDLGRRAQERTGRAPRQTLHDFLIAYETLGQDAALPIIRPFVVEPGLEGNAERKSQLSRTALFRRNRLVAELDETETEMLLILQGEVETFLEVVDTPGDPGKLTAFRAMGATPKVKVDVSGLEPKFVVDVVVEAEALETESSLPLLDDSEGIQKLEGALASSLASKARALVKKLQQDCGCDAIGLGHNLRVRFLDWASWERYHWPGHFPKANVTVNVRVLIRRSGMTFQPVKAR